MPQKLFAASAYTLALLFGFLGVIFFLILYFAGTVDWIVLIGMVVGFNVLIWLIGPWFTDLVHKWLYKMHFLKHEEVETQFPEVAAFIAKVTAEHHIKFPKIGFIEDNNPTAYTYGSGSFNARIILTRGLFTYLNKDEIESVVAHELGHIVHRDFIVMAVANTIIQLFYAVYSGLGRKKGGGKGDSKSALGYIGLLAYIFYVLGTYIVLYLNRIRESYADEFSAQVTGSPHSLSHALIKIGYGIMAKEETKTSQSLMENTATLGIMGLKPAKQVGLVAKVTNMDPLKVGRVLLYDLISPWAWFAELVSTHPLTGKRIERLEILATTMGQAAMFNFQQLRTDHAEDKKGVRAAFFHDAFFYYLPTILIIGLPVIIFAVAGIFFPSISFSELFGMYLILIAFGYFVKTFYRFPNPSTDAPATMLELMSDLYASPARGRAVHVEGQIIGRGVPGFVFSEDVMLQDSTGLMYLDYESGIPIVGNVLFAWKRVQTLLGKQAKVVGWFFRSNTQAIALSSLEVEGTVFKSYNRFWNYVFAVIVFFLGVMSLANQTWIFHLWFVVGLGGLIVYAMLARRNKIQSKVDKELQDAQKVSGQRVLKGVLIGILVLIVVIVIIAAISG